MKAFIVCRPRYQMDVHSLSGSTTRLVREIILFALTSSFFLLGSLAIVSSIGQAEAGTVDWWSMFHHDLNHSGYSGSTAPNKNITKWGYTTGDKVLSSPAVADGYLYLGSSDNSTYCLNAATGALIWKYTTGGIVLSSPCRCQRHRLLRLTGWRDLCLELRNRRFTMELYNQLLCVFFSRCC